MHCIDFFSGSFEDMGIFQVFQFSFDRGGVISNHNRLIDKYMKNVQIFKTTTQKKERSTQCIILLHFLLFSQLKIICFYKI